jgi:hypothetical protein
MAAPPKQLKPWVKGQSGNPGGRPKALVDVQQMARTHTPEAINALVAALKVPQTRVPAAVALLDRGWGKAAQVVVGPDGGALAMTIQVVTGVTRDDEPQTIEAETEEIGHYQIDGTC